MHYSIKRYILPFLGLCLFLFGAYARNVKIHADDQMYSASGGSSGPSGTGSAGRVTLWSDASTLTSDTGLTYSGTGATFSSVFGTTTTAGTAKITTLGTMSGSSLTSNFLNITGTLPASTSAITAGVYMPLVSAGSSAQLQLGQYLTLGAGYTGSSWTGAGVFTNNVAGTGTFSSLGSAAGNYGLNAAAQATTTGTNTGVFATGSGGGSALGVVGYATGGTTATVGGTFVANTGGFQVGAFAGLGTALPTFASAALIADNGAVAAPIAIFRDNGTAKVDIKDGGTTTVGSDVVIGFSSTTDATAAADAMISRGAAATLQLGDANAASPVSQTIKAQGSRSGTDTNIGGGSLTIRAGDGTGLGVNSKTQISRNIPVASGSGAQLISPALTVCQGRSISTTTGTATALATIGLANNTSGGLRATVTVQCTDGTNFDSDLLTTYVAYVNKAGTLTFGTPVTTASAAANNSGSCTVAPTIVANGTTAVDFKVTPVFTTIVPTTVIAMVNLETFGQNAGTVVCN